jgi:hypothetical protein
MKCVLEQAGHATGEWLSLAFSGTSASQCCTFIPVWGHLKRMGRSMVGNMPVAALHQNYGCLLRSHSRKRILRRLIGQQLQNRLSPDIIFLIWRGQQPAIMFKILPMNELLHSDLPEVHGLNPAVPPPSIRDGGPSCSRGVLAHW